MKLQVAIEIKCRTGEEFLNTDPSDIDEADRLSIEALKLIQFGRYNNMILTANPLPGETDE